MAAKKRAKKKATAKKKPSSKSRQTSKKKSAKKAKAKSKPKNSSKPKTISVKKVAGKKKALKKAKPLGFDVSKGPTIETIEVPPVVIIPMSIDAVFKLGLGQLTAVLIRSGKELATEMLTQSGQILFEDVRTKDIISISGVCSGTAEITTDRSTRPATDPANPRKFKEQQILDLLKVL